MSDVKQKKRKISQGFSKVLDVGEVHRIQYNELSGAQKGLDVGGFWIPRGSLANAATGQTFGAGKGKSIRIFNPTAGVLFVRTGVAGATDSFNGKLAVPFNDAVIAANGIPVGAGETLLMNMGEDTHIKGSAAGMFIYELDDESKLVPRETSELRAK